MAQLDAKEVRDIALLARLQLGDDEVVAMGRDLGNILAYIEKLNTLDTAGVEPMTHAVPMDCPLRTDEVGESLSREDALRGAPRRSDDFFEVPRILDGGS